MYELTLARKIQERKAECPYVFIENIKEGCYYLRDLNNKTYTLYIDFVDMDVMPGVGDGFYLSENIIEGMREKLYSYTFSTRIGEECARPPHVFLVNPEEFLIFEYQEGKTILLEQWYG